MGNWLSKKSANADDHVDLAFISMGMVVLDEIHVPSQVPLFDVLGGSGAYANLGARLLTGYLLAKRIGTLVVAGNDFPRGVEAELSSWNTFLVLKKETSRPSTRGRLEYQDATFGPKKFEYTTEPLKPTAGDLPASSLLKASAIHLLGSPEHILEQYPYILARRRKIGIQSRPTIVWKPFPASCKPLNREAYMQACRLVDVFSPNHLEMTALFTETINESLLQPIKLQRYAKAFLDASVGPAGEGCVVIRAAEHGCLVASRAEGMAWLSAFYPPGSSKAVDPTGAGNAFLGGFTIGLQGTGSVVKAAGYGNVAAGFALEQVGLPKLDRRGFMDETWNGSQVSVRLHEYLSRTEENVVFVTNAGTSK